MNAFAEIFLAWLACLIALPILVLAVAIVGHLILAALSGAGEGSAEEDES